MIGEILINMKCFNCGKETKEYLCADCRTEGILGKIFEQIRFYKPETCENPYLVEYVATLTGPLYHGNAP